MHSGTPQDVRLEASCHLGPRACSCQPKLPAHKFKDCYSFLADPCCCSLPGSMPTGGPCYCSRLLSVSVPLSWLSPLLASAAG